MDVQTKIYRLKSDGFGYVTLTSFKDRSVWVTMSRSTLPSDNEIAAMNENEFNRMCQDILYGNFTSV